MPATAIVQFIGLILLSTKLSPGSDQNLRAMIPRIPGPHAETHGNPSPAEQAMIDTDVEKHVAFISFRESDYDAHASNWKAEKMPGKELLYVRLDGEQIRFITTSRTPERRRPLTARVSARLTDIDLSVRHLQLCCTQPSLRAEYMGPHFPLAAAVFDLPEGSARICNGPGPQGHERRDTIVSLENDGVLIIEAQKSHRHLVLKGAAEVTVGNMPSDYFGETSAGGKGFHSRVWDAIVDSKQACVLKPNCDSNARTAQPCPVSPSAIAIAGPSASPIASAIASPSASARPIASATSPSDRRQPLPTTFSNVLGAPHTTAFCEYCRMDEQCSNTQWP